MTALDEHSTAIARARAAESETFDDLLSEAAELVIRAGRGSAAMIGRKMRVGHATAEELLAELHELGVVGPDTDGAREVLAGEGDVLARIATRGATEDEPADSHTDDHVADGGGTGEVVSLAKVAPRRLRLVDSPPEGGALAVRPDGEVADSHTGGRCAGWDDPPEEATSPFSVRGVAEWVRWHLLELTAVATPAAAAVAVHPAWWVAAGGIGARWAALEWRIRHPRGGRQ